MLGSTVVTVLATEKLVRFLRDVYNEHIFVIRFILTNGVNLSKSVSIEVFYKNELKVTI